MRWWLGSDFVEWWAVFGASGGASITLETSTGWIVVDGDL